MTQVVPYGQYQGVGLEDIKASDLVTPRLSIDHKKNLFVNSLSKETSESVNVILLALVKTRIMWPPELDDSSNSAPQCRSNDFEIGFPNVDPKAPADKRFPWTESVFDPTAGPQGLYLPQVMEEVGLPALPCDQCLFKDWVNKKTRCKEQWVFPLILMNEDGTERMPAILTLQGSGIAPSKAYVSTFAAQQQPLFTRFTQLSLQQLKRGMNEYSVPVLRDAGATDLNQWDEYAARVPGMRDFIRRPPTPRNVDDAPVAVASPAQAAAANVNVPVPVPQAAPVQVAQPQVVEHIPAPAAVPVPVPQTAPAAVVPVPQAAPAVIPVPEAAPPAQPPAVQPVAVAPPVTPAAVPSEAVAVESSGDDGLPF